ncbi:MAG: hypothetical protein CNE88_03495 [Acidimicrobiales bacterium MED-G01]|nr:MAG: hypothetical protein CNE88_03495 [Acidimicrobiales bacterium MED-G01]
MVVNLTPNEILIICLVALIALGPKQLPETARKIAKGFGQLRRQSSQLRAEFTSVVDQAVEESHDQELLRRAKETDSCASQDPNPRDLQ